MTKWILIPNQITTNYFLSNNIKALRPFYPWQVLIFFPFYPKGKWIPKEDILSATWIKVKPMKDLGGYGYRNRPQQEVFVLRGHHALQIKLKNAKKALIIGVLNPEKVGEVFHLAGLAPKNNTL